MAANSSFSRPGGSMRASAWGLAALLAAAGASMAGCAPEIGDSCNTTSDCSISGERVCDTTQPGGYCTVQFCDPDTCPDGGVCVQWRFEPPRTAETWCMRSCKKDGGCRDGYLCVGPDLYDGDGEPLARVVDIEERQKFCAAVVPGPVPNAGPLPDGGGADAATDAAVPDADR